MSGRKSLVKIAAVLVALLLGLLVGCGSGDAPADAPAEPALPLTVTVNIEFGESEMTLASVNWNATSEDSTPEEGNKFITAMLEFKNISSHQYEPFRSIYFSYQAADGTVYEESTALAEDDLFATGFIAPGESSRGNVIYEVPADIADDTGAFIFDISGDIYTLPVDGSEPSLPAGQETEEPTSEATETESADAGSGATIEVVDGDEGSGPVVLDSNFATVSVPADAGYEVENWSYEAARGRGVLEITFTNASGAPIEFVISTTRMVESLDDAVAECERMNKFDDSWAVERLDDVTFNGTNYAHVTMATDDRQYDHYVHYYLKDEIDFYVEMRVPIKGYAYSIALDDPLVVDVMNSIEYK